VAVVAKGKTRVLRLPVPKMKRKKKKKKERIIQSQPPKHSFFTANRQGNLERKKKVCAKPAKSKKQNRKSQKAETKEIRSAKVTG